MSHAKEIFQLRKANRKDKTLLGLVRKYYAEDSSDIWLQRAYGWVIYDLIKADVRAFKAKQKPPEYLAIRLSHYLQEYRQIGEKIRPDLLHSILLTQVLQGSRVWFGFLNFACWWGVENFRDTDKKPYSPLKGRKVASLETRFIYAVGREAYNHFEEINADILEWAEDLLNSALEVSPNEQWFNFYKSILLNRQGDVNKARKFLFPAVRRQQNAAWAWAWSLLGRTYERENPETSITAYLRAVHVARKLRKLSIHAKRSQNNLPGRGTSKKLQDKSEKH